MDAILSIYFIILRHLIVLVYNCFIAHCTLEKTHPATSHMLAASQKSELRTQLSARATRCIQHNTRVFSYIHPHISREDARNTHAHITIDAERKILDGRRHSDGACVHISLRIRIWDGYYSRKKPFCLVACASIYPDVARIPSLLTGMHYRCARRRCFQLFFSNEIACAIG